ncbi:hypothetical protein DMB66_17160 [Actinoplanes sp. ATCC 53533]|nr:hypothetical protein DMB66_17160 [Actinoplanes sp. ATCC 53533]
MEVGSGIRMAADGTALYDKDVQRQARLPVRPPALELGGAAAPFASMESTRPSRYAVTSANIPRRQRAILGTTRASGQHCFPTRCTGLRTSRQWTWTSSKIGFIVEQVRSPVPESPLCSARSIPISCGRGPLQAGARRRSWRHATRQSPGRPLG